MDTSLPFIPANFYAKPFPFLVVDNHTEFGDPRVEGRAYPDFRVGLSPENLVPLACYTVLWYSLNMTVNIYCWTSWKKGLRRRRLVNLTTSLTHSVMCGVFLFLYLCRNPRLMFASPFHYYSFPELQIVLISMGYFIYDAIDVVINDVWNVGNVVLMVHHVACVIFLSIVVSSHKYLLYAYWALMMEVSSIFLHCRAILNQSKLSTTSMIGLYKVLSYVNIVAFIPFRFLIQAFLALWTYVNMYNLHLFFLSMSVLCTICFLATNCALFLRLLHSDGFLCPHVSKEQLGSFGEDIEYEEVERVEELSAEKSLMS